MSRRLVRARALLRRRLVHRGVILATGLVGVGLAAFVAYKATLPRRSRIHDRPSAHDFAQAVLGRRPGRLERRRPVSLESSLPSDLAQIITLARQTAQVATEIETHDPGKNRDEWRNYADEMRRSSVQLAQTTQENNQLAMLAAARRLDASCLKCHEVFRQ